MSVTCTNVLMLPLLPLYSVLIYNEYTNANICSLRVVTSLNIFLITMHTNNFIETNTNE